MAMTNATGRTIPAWAVVLLGVVASMIAVVLIFGGTAQAQQQGAHDLNVTKTPNRAMNLKVGQNFTWTVRVTNERGGVARNVVMVDNLPSFVRFVRASTSLQRPGICGPINNRGGVSCSLGNLRVGETVTIRVTGNVIKAGRGRNVASIRAGGQLGGGFGEDIQPSDNRDTTRHRAVERRGGDGRCGVRAEAGKNRAKACVGGVKAIGRR